MRLIDEKKLIGELDAWWETLDSRTDSTICDVIEAVIDKIDDIPTAYDLENVIKTLGKELKLAEMDKEQVMIENPLQFDYVRGYAMGISNALEIVKDGFE